MVKGRMMDNSEVYTLIEVARILKTKLNTVRIMVRTGKIPAVKVGREYRVAKEDLEAFIGGRKG
jgi:excisionase family DNA binding protein